jgi:hypothetical protein
MVIGYREAFGLNDNPFGPITRICGLPPSLTREMQARPLLIHRNPGLELLYCEDIAASRTACQDLETTLETAGYRAEPPERGISSYLVAIEGDRGSGKTTLASRMMQIVKKRQPLGESEWVIYEINLDATTEAASDQAAKIQEVEKRILAEKPEYCCVLVDDLRADAYRFALQTYDKLTDTTAIMFLTSSDAAFGAQVNNTRQAVQHFSIPRLTPDDALAFVNHRYKIFRVPPGALATVPLFPFDELDIRRAVAAQVFDGALRAGPVTVRLIGTLLRSALHQRLLEINRAAQPFDVYAVPPNELTRHVIRLAESYRTLVFT